MEKLGMQKWAVFRLVSKHSLNINFLFYFLYELLMSLRTADQEEISTRLLKFYVLGNMFSVLPHSRRLKSPLMFCFDIFNLKLFDFNQWKGKYISYRELEIATRSSYNTKGIKSHVKLHVKSDVQKVNMVRTLLEDGLCHSTKRNETKQVL